MAKNIINDLNSLSKNESDLAKESILLLNKYRKLEERYTDGGGNGNLEVIY